MAPDRIIAIALLAGSAMAGLSVALPTRSPVPKMAVIGALLIALIPASMTATLALFIFGGLFTLQSSNGLGAAKLGYLAIVLVTAGSVVLRLVGSRDTRARTARLYLFGGAGYLAVTGLIAHAHAISMVFWARDILPYLLFAIAPGLALVASYRLSERTITRLIVVSGIVGSLAFFVVWVAQRKIASLPVTYLGYPSFYLPFALFIYAGRRYLDKKGGRWLLLMVVAIGPPIATGTRTFLIGIPIIWMIMIAAGRGRGVAAQVKAVALPVLLVVLFITTVPLLIQTSGISKNGFNQRITAVGTLFKNPSADGSFYARSSETKVAYDTFKSAPVLGVGPGQNFQYNSLGLGPQFLRNLDTGVSFLSKFGLLGVAVLLGGAVAFCRVVPRWRRGNVAADSIWVLLGLAALTIPLRIPTEDPGFTYALVLLLALAWIRDREGAADIAPTAPRSRHDPR